MNGEIAQLCHLSSFANSGILGHLDIRALEHYPVMQYCSFEFREMPIVAGRLALLNRRRLVSKDPERWIRGRIALGCRRFELALDRPEPTRRNLELERNLSGFAGGGGAWSLILHYPAAREMWQSSWTYTKSPKAWHVRYTGARKNAFVLKHEPPSIADCANHLTDALAQISAFARDYTGDAQALHRVEPTDDE